MARAHLSWPRETIGYRADIIDLQERIIPLLEVCVDEGIIRQRYNVIEMLLPSIDDQAHDTIKLARTISHCRPLVQRGRPPKWVEITEEVIACCVGILDCIHEIKIQMRRGGWGTVATSLRVCLNLSNEIIEQLRIIESDPIPRAFYEDTDGKLNPGRWRSKKE